MLRESREVRLPGIMVRKTIKAGWTDDWSELMKSVETSPWMMVKLKENFSRRSSTVTSARAMCMMQKSTDFLRRNSVPVEGEGWVTLSYVCVHCHRYPLEDCIWFVSTGHGDESESKKRQCNRGGDDWRSGEELRGDQGGQAPSSARRLTRTRLSRKGWAK